MRASSSVLGFLALLTVHTSGCGGRDPLGDPIFPPADQDADATPAGDASAVVPPTNRDGAVVNPPPPPPPPPPGTPSDGPIPPPPIARDAGPVTPPIGVPDAAIPARDAQTPPMVCKFPKCVATLMIGCEPQGACVQQRAGGGGGGGGGNNVCYANGVKFIQSMVFNGMGGGATNVTRVTRADGTLCYSMESSGGGRNGGNGGLIVYRGPTGAMVATASLDQQFLAVACPGEPPQVVASSCQPGLSGGRGGGPTCGQGMCM